MVEAGAASVLALQNAGAKAGGIEMGWGAYTLQRLVMQIVDRYALYIVGHLTMRGALMSAGTA